MQLTPRQFSTLNEMGIPVWELRSNDSVEQRSVTDEIISTEPSQQLLQCDCIVIIESPIQNNQAQRLLQAMLLSIGITEQQVAIINPDQLPQLHKVPSENKILLVLGNTLAQSLFGGTISRGEPYQTLESDLPTIVSFALEDLLNSPENKALAWQDLQLVKQCLT